MIYAPRGFAMGRFCFAQKYIKRIHISIHNNRKGVPHELEKAACLHLYQQLLLRPAHHRRGVGGAAGCAGLLAVGDRRCRERVPHGQPHLRGAERHGGGPAGPQEDTRGRRGLHGALQPPDGLCAGPVFHLPGDGAERTGQRHVLRHRLGPHLRQPQAVRTDRRLPPCLRQLLPALHAGHGCGVPRQHAGTVSPLFRFLPAERRL